MNSRELAHKLWREAIHPAYADVCEEVGELEPEDHEAMLQVMEGILEREAGVKPDLKLQAERDKNDEVCT